MKYRVESPITYNRDKYAIGDPIELPVKVAAPLLNGGSISEIDHLQVEIDSEAHDLQAAIAGLDTADIDLWTKEGKPELSPLAEILNRKVSAIERDAAWRQYQQANS